MQQPFYLGADLSPLLCPSHAVSFKCLHEARKQAFWVLSGPSSTLEGAEQDKCLFPLHLPLKVEKLLPPDSSSFSEGVRGGGGNVRKKIGPKVCCPEAAVATSSELKWDKGRNCQASTSSRSTHPHLARLQGGCST